MLRQSHVITTEAVVALSFQFALTQNADVKTLGVILPVMAGAYVGAQMPDIDHPKTKINKIMGPIGDFFAMIGHRGITHSLLAIFLVFAPLFAYAKSQNTTFFDLHLLQLTQASASTILILIYFGFALGYLLHILEDSFSSQGVLWFSPLTHWKKSSGGFPYKNRLLPKIFYYHTGSGAETIIKYFFLIVLILTSFSLLGELHILG